jgi:hypothetical protein
MFQQADGFSPQLPSFQHHTANITIISVMGTSEAVVRHFNDS